MAFQVHAPRVNNNDDVVTVVGLAVALGDHVKAGQVVAQVETDKAVVDVEAPKDGFVVGIVAKLQQKADVGSTLLWLADVPGETPPAIVDAAARADGGESGRPTAKAAQMLHKHGLTARDVPATGSRLTVEDVERYLAAGRTGGAVTRGRAEPDGSVPDVAGTFRELRSDERAMVATVSWHRDEAAAGYIELAYDPAPWEAYAKAFAERHRLLFSPLLALLAWRLVEIAAGAPTLNATLIAGQRYEYKPVNLGFTMQVDDRLYLAVVADAAGLDEIRFVQALGDLQRRAAAHQLRADETRGATLGFSSMARWKVRRHVPLLAPRTALMVAHAAGADDAVLGASYDHRVLNGYQVVSALRKLAAPPKPAEGSGD